MNLLNLESFNLRWFAICFFLQFDLTESDLILETVPLSWSGGLHLDLCRPLLVRHCLLTSC